MTPKGPAMSRRYALGSSKEVNHRGTENTEKALGKQLAGLLWPPFILVFSVVSVPLWFTSLAAFDICMLQVPTLALGQEVATKSGKAESFVYRKTKEADLSLHIQFPADWKATDRRPAMVFFFGG